MRVAAAAGIFISSLGCAMAQNPAPALKVVLCKAIEDGSARLKCYDEAIAALVTPAPPAPEPATKDLVWSVTDGKSPIDDAANVVGTLTATNGDAMMALRCKEHQTDALVTFQKYLGSADTVRVIYRIDDEKAVQARWGASSTGRAVFAPKAVSFIRSLKKDGTLFVRAFDFQGASSDATFKLGDFDELRAKIALLCKWPRPSDQRPKRQSRRRITSRKPR